MASHCPTSDVTRSRCAVLSPTYTRVDPSVADLVQGTLGRGTHVRAILAGAPSSGSSLRGRASHYGGSYAASRARWYARLAAVGVPVVRRSEGRRVVLCLGPAYAPCVGALCGRAHLPSRPAVYARDRHLCDRLERSLLGGTRLLADSWHNAGPSCPSQPSPYPTLPPYPARAFTARLRGYSDTRNLP